MSSRRPFEGFNAVQLDGRPSVSNHVHLATPMIQSKIAFLSGFAIPKVSLTAEWHISPIYSIRKELLEEFEAKAKQEAEKKLEAQKSQMMEDPQKGTILQQAGPLNVVARTLGVATTSGALIPMEQAVGKLVRRRAERNTTANLLGCLRDIAKEGHLFKGFGSRTTSNIVKSAGLFGIQAMLSPLTGPVAAFGIAGLVNGGATAGQQFLDFRLRQAPEATNYLHIFKQTDWNTLWKSRKPILIGAMNGGSFWAFYTASIVNSEQMIKNFFNKKGLGQDSIVFEATLASQFACGLAGGALNWSFYRVTQILIKNPDLCVADVLLGPRPKTAQEIIPFLKSSFRTAYCSSKEGLTLFAVNNMLKLAAIRLADKAVETVNPPKENSRRLAK